jgi:hypothetical protein
MSSSCEIQAGFFTLRVCGQPPAGFCHRCRRTVCERHATRSATGAVLCLDCAAQEPDDLGNLDEPVAGQRWLYRLRQARHKRRRSSGQETSTDWAEPFWTTDDYATGWQDRGDVDHDWDDTDGSYSDS